MMNFIEHEYDGTEECGVCKGSEKLLTFKSSLGDHRLLHICEKCHNKIEATIDDLVRNKPKPID